MATEVESAWSPAKRFTLVKPTFKGIEFQKLTRSHLSTPTGSFFGSNTDVSDDGNTLAVGTYVVDGQGQSQYAVAVFEKTDGYFSIQQVLILPYSNIYGTPSEQNVSISGDGNTIALGLSSAEAGFQHAGSVNIFTRSGSVWEYSALLTAAVKKVRDFFGAAVSLNYDGTVCAIGTSNSSVEGSVGSAYVFQKIDNSVGWFEKVKIVPPDGIVRDWFGRRLSISGDGKTLAVSATSDANNPRPAYIYVENGGVWSLQARLDPYDGNLNNAIGSNISVSHDGNVCALLSMSVQPGVFVFERTGTTWSQTAKIPTGPNVYSSHMSRDGKTCIVGLTYGQGGAGTMNGKALVYVKRNGVWTSPIELMPVDGQRDESFGRPVLLNGDGTTAFIGTYSNMAGHIDAVYVFV